MTLTDDNVALYADTLVLQVRAGGGRELDYTPDSLGIVEDMVRASERYQSDDLSGPKADLLIFYAGCYLGEVMVRHLGGAWKFEDDWPQSSLIFPVRADGNSADANLPESGVQVFPFDKLRRRLTDGPIGNDLVDYYFGLADRLEAARSAGL